MPLETLGEVMTSDEFGAHMALEVMKTQARKPVDNTDPELKAMFETE